MVSISDFNNISSSKAVVYDDFKSADTIDEDISIFSTVNEETSSTEENAEALYNQLEEVQDENGVIRNAWNNFKEFTNIGASAEKCEDAISQYEAGEITYDEASEIIANYDTKQESSLNLFSNIATSIAAIVTVAAVAATGGAALPVVAAIGIGAGAGAVTKTGFKFADRATNDVEGDALDAKQMAQDALSGAVTGGIAASTMGTAGGFQSAGQAAGKCALTGVKTGAVSSGSNYIIDCTFDEDKEFDLKEFAVETATGAAVGGIVGGIMGGANYGLRSTGVLSSGCNLSTMVSSAENVSSQDVVANSVCTAEYKILTDRINNIAP